MRLGKLVGYMAFSAVLVATPAAFAAAGGTVVKVDGKAVVERGGDQFPVTESFGIESGDVLSVSEGAKVQVHFQDDSFFSIPGEAKLRVDEFAMSRQSAGGSAIFSLLRGGLRAITGLISKGHNDRYELRTPAITIGVRGTAYSVVICDGACTAGGKFKAGVYARSENGTVIVANAAGKLTLKAGQAAYAESNTSAPVRVKVSPFSDPKFATQFGIDVDFGTQIQPPRIEQEPAPSPS
jgi:hypothetical protein